MYQEQLEDNSYYGEARDEDTQERAIRLNALCRVYEQADRVVVLVVVIYYGEDSDGFRHRNII